MIVEHTLGYQTARNGRVFQIHGDVVQVLLLPLPKLLNLNDWVTAAKLVDTLIYAIQLIIIARLNISSVVLVKVVKLVINVNVFLHLGCDVCKADPTVTHVWISRVFINRTCAFNVVPSFILADLITHHVEHDTDCQEDHTKDAESEHGAHGGWYRPPSRKCLLLEL